MKKPTQTFPMTPSPVLPKFGPNLIDPLLHPDAFNQILTQRGIKFTHYKATFCPNVLDLETAAHDPNCTICENGMIMYGSKEITGVFGNSTLERIYQAQGQWELGNAVVTFPTVYSDGTEADFQAFDKLVCEGYTHRTFELVQYDHRDAYDKVRYPIISVDMVRSKDVIFTEGTDFEVLSDGIRWLPDGKQPNWIPELDKGEVYTISYCANPVYVVVQLLHEIRATQAKNPAANGKIAVRLPQQVLIRRDFLMYPARANEHRGTSIVTKSRDLSEDDVG